MWVMKREAERVEGRTLLALAVADKKTFRGDAVHLYDAVLALRELEFDEAKATTESKIDNWVKNVRQRLKTTTEFCAAAASGEAEADQAMSDRAQAALEQALLEDASKFSLTPEEEKKLAELQETIPRRKLKPSK